MDLDIKDDIIADKLLKEIDKIKKYAKKQKKTLEELLDNKFDVRMILDIQPKGE
jgi:acyl-ACP thioesterase